MLVCRGEVRESGLTGVTRNHVSPCGSGGSNPPLSAKQSVVFTYNLEIAANPRGRGAFALDANRRKLSRCRFAELHGVFSTRRKNGSVATKNSI